MKKKIFRSIILAVGAVLLASLVIILGCMYDYFGSVYEEQLKDELEIAAAGVENGGIGSLAQLDSQRFRLTWIKADGSVIYDTETGVSPLENHADRPEVIQALEKGEGSSCRYSTTLLQKTLYQARRLDDGSVLRISISRATVGVVLLGMVQPILLVLIVALVLSWLLAGRLSKRIVSPLNDLDLDHPLENDAYEDLSPLLNRINRQHQQINDQLHTLRRKTDEFAQTVRSMKEGLVLLDDKRTVMSINPAARRIFSADGDCVGQDFLTVDRSRHMSSAVTQALESGHSETRDERAGRIYQFDISRIESENRTIGAVILAFDITEQENGERNRREFTANVSHELKTPIQGIIGSAELIENGMVKAEDLPRFIGHIRQEASRLVTLIDDIIRLSQLDEGDEMPEEEMDLLDIAEETAADISDAARAKNVTVLLEGEPAPMRGVRRLIYEVVYNLCDNGIKYNRENGELRINTGIRDGRAFVTVSDTGIGIAPEHQKRVFERFYRVDKSHSKASGGTGLGLSIVKHAVQYHHGEISLSSEPGKGTTITVTFPAER